MYNVFWIWLVYKFQVVWILSDEISSSFQMFQVALVN
jgi:hypothetical protein